MLLSALGSAQPGLAQSSGCSQIIWRRNLKYDANKNYLQLISIYQEHISAIKSQMDLLSGGAFESAKAELAQNEKDLKDAQAKQQDNAKKLKELDAEVERCRNGRSTESTGGPWAGTWISPDRTYKFFSISGQVYFNTTSANGSVSGEGSCAISGNTANCKYEERFGTGAQAVNMFGSHALTLSGDTITDRKTLENVQCVGGPDSACATARKSVGKTLEETWHRK